MDWGFVEQANTTGLTAPSGVTYEYHDFTDLHLKAPRDLIIELCSVHTDLANLCEHIAFLKANEQPRQPNRERIMAEGSRDALAEKKWLILKLLEGIS
jgi:hypothetical protein